MPSVSIVIDVAGKPPGVPGVGREFPYSDIASAPPEVTLSLDDNTGITEYYWEIVYQEPGCSAVLDDPNSATPKFTPTAGAEGTYLIRCEVNGGPVFGTNAIGFTTQSLAIRLLAAGETLEFGSAGWIAAYNAAMKVLDGYGGASYDEEFDTGSVAADSEWEQEVDLGNSVVSGIFLFLKVVMTSGSSTDTDIEVYNGDPSGSGERIYLKAGKDLDAEDQVDPNIWWSTKDFLEAGKFWLRLYNHGSGACEYTFRVRFRGDVPSA